MQETTQERAERLVKIIEGNMEDGRVTRSGMYDTLIFWDTIPVQERREVYDASVVLLKDKGLYEVVNEEIA